MIEKVLSVCKAISEFGIALYDLWFLRNLFDSEDSRYIPVNVFTAGFSVGPGLQPLMMNKVLNPIGLAIVGEK